jgi:hypothetical protein
VPDVPAFDPTSPDWSEQRAERIRARATAGVVPVRGDFPGRTWVLAHIEAGWPIYSTTRRYTGTEEPIGGVVVDVLPAALDPDTGEITPTRYRVLDVYRPSHPWQVLEAPEVSESALEGVGRQLATTGAYWLLRQVNLRRKVLHPDDVALIRDAHVLGAAVVTL